MFYFSRGEQIVLAVLLALLLTGAGVLVYSRGERAGQGGDDLPLFVEAPATAPAEAVEAATTPEAAGTAEAETPSPDPTSERRAGSASRNRVPSPSFPIRLNSATARELEALPGIGPVLAGRIVQYREQLQRERGHGFESVDELLNVSGIGPKRLAAVRDLVTL